MRVIGYLRVSTASQEHGIDAQRAAIAGEASRKGWQVQFIEDAGRSGKSIERPGIQAALEALARGEAEALVVSKLDRLSRSMVDFARLLDLAANRGWSIIALDLNLDTSTPTGKLVASVMAAVAQWERETIGLRTREGLAAARAKGIKIGRQSTVPKSVARQIVHLRAEGMTFQAIADRLNKAKVPTPGGAARWRHASVRYVELRAA